MRITGTEKEALLELAERAIVEKISPGQLMPGRELELTDTMKCKCGAFVSVYIEGELRGCIGTFSEEEDLFRTVERMAVSAAVFDSRFSPVQFHELAELMLEISVLSPRQRIYDPSEIIIGKHGIFIQQDSSRGTLLPQVAVNQNWSVEEFLGNCSKYKARIGWDGWKAAELYIFEAIIFRSPAPSR
jgi:AmmeMemoRadiSam system protein A